MPQFTKDESALKRAVIKRGFLVRIENTMPYPTEVYRNRRETKINVTDDWYGTYEDGTCKMILHDDNRVSIWGNDDFAMEKFNCTLEDFELLRMATVNKDYLSNIGFVVW